MRITFLLPTAYDLGGTAGAVATQTGFLCDRHDVQVVSVHRDRDRPHFDFDERVRLVDAVDLRPGHERAGDLTSDQVRALRGRPTRLVDPAVDPQLDALADVGLEVVLPALETDVLVTVTPALLAVATTLAPPTVAVVHQEHRSSSGRATSRGLLLDVARRADAVAVLVEPMATWLRRRLGPGAPAVVAVPNALPPAYRPRSPLTSPVVLAAGRIASEKQYPQLVSAFALVADDLPGWRLRILGDGPHRFSVVSAVRRHELWDRVELPGATDDLAVEWARASVSALTSSSEGYPLVVQEAMAAGVPVVAYDCPSGPREIIHDGVDGLLVAPGSVEAMAAGLHRLATDHDERSRLGAAARISSARWDPASIAPRWEAVYEAAVRRRAGRATGRSTVLHLGALEPLHPVAPAPPGGGPGDPDTAPPDREGRGVTPEQARHAALRSASEAARQVAPDGTWWVLPPHGAYEPTVVLPMTARRPLLAALARAEQEGTLPAYLSVHDPAEHGWPGARGTAVEMAQALARGRTPRLRLEPWPRVGSHASLLGEGCGVTVELWEEGPEGRLHGPVRAGGDRAASSPRSPALVRARVNGVDVPVPPAAAMPTTDTGTFEVEGLWWPSPRSGPDTLRWSMRSVHLLAPWVRRLHVVLEEDAPDWLDADHPAVQVLTRAPGDPGGALGLLGDTAEHLLVLDPGILLTRPRHVEQFFTAGGSTGVPGPSGPGDTIPVEVRRVVEHALGRAATPAADRAPAGQLRSRLSEAAAYLGGQQSPALMSRVGLVSHQLGLAGGTAHRSRGGHLTLDLDHPNVGAHLTALLERDHDGVALENHGHPARDPLRIDQLLRETLELLMPLPAPWER